MIKKNHKFNKNTKFGREPVLDKDMIRMISQKKKRLKSSGKKWNSTESTNQSLGLLSGTTPLPSISGGKFSLSSRNTTLTNSNKL